jgi:anti-sigma regulatory factor (Ser/Thr protein kinase)
MKLADVRRLLSAEVLCGEDLSVRVDRIGAADLMSDVLALSTPGMLLLTGLRSPQVIRTAVVSDLCGVVFVRDKKPTDPILNLARQRKVPVLRTHLTMFEAAGVLYGALHSNHSEAEQLETVFEIKGGDFLTAGDASTAIKDTLKRLGVPAIVVRRVAIAAYEAEMNVVMYAKRGRVTLNVNPTVVTLECVDEGPGIENVELAMQEGYSTATAEMREMGFGAGMGLPNIKKHSDEFQIFSDVGRGTRLLIRVRQAA